MGSGLEYLFIGNGTGIQKMKINFSRPDPIHASPSSPVFSSAIFGGKGSVGLRLWHYEKPFWRTSKGVRGLCSRSRTVFSGTSRHLFATFPGGCTCGQAMLSISCQHATPVSQKSGATTGIFWAQPPASASGENRSSLDVIHASTPACLNSQRLASATARRCLRGAGARACG